MAEQPSCGLQPGQEMKIYFVRYDELADASGASLLNLHNDREVLVAAVQAYHGCDGCALRSQNCPGGQVNVTNTYEAVSYGFTRPGKEGSHNTARQAESRLGQRNRTIGDVLVRRAVEVANCGMQPGGVRAVTRNEVDELVRWEGAKEVAGCWDCPLLNEGCSGAVAKIVPNRNSLTAYPTAEIGRPNIDGTSPFVDESKVGDVSDGTHTRDEANCIDVQALASLDERLKGMNWWQRGKYFRSEERSIQERFGDQKHRSKSQGNKGKRSKRK